MSLYDPRPPVDLAGDRTLWSRLVDRTRHVHVTIMGWATPALADAVSAGRTTSTDLHDWDGRNPHHRPFAYGADLVFVSGSRLDGVEHDVVTDVLDRGRARLVVVMDGARGSRVTVRDGGPGIPEFAEGKVFEKFYSLARPATAKKSTGLGLSFVKEIADLHRGRATLKNGAAGGAVATLSLPRAERA